MDLRRGVRVVLGLIEGLIERRIVAILPALRRHGPFGMHRERRSEAGKRRSGTVTVKVVLGVVAVFAAGVLAAGALAELGPLSGIVSTSTTETTTAPSSDTATAPSTRSIPVDTLSTDAVPTDSTPTDTTPTDTTSTDTSAPVPSGPPTPYIVTFVAGTSDADATATLIAAGGSVDSRIAPLRMYSVSFPADVAAADAAALAGSAVVARVEQDLPRNAAGIPDDTDYAAQWALTRIGWDQAYDAVTPTGSATVAVLDTGVDASNPDLAANVVPGTSILDGSDGTTDPNGHGTSMAGIVAAATNNALGIAGVGFAGVKVMPVTVLGADGTGQDSDVIAGVVWAADHGADVILMSFSNPGYSASLQAAVDYAWSRNVVLVAATGNDGSSLPTFPAGDRGVMGVSSTNLSDGLSSSSNYGADTFLAAPGEGIASVNGTMSGTSASAAIVAGSAALLRASSVGASNGVIVSRLARNADPAGTSDQTGNGRVNLARAILDTSSDSVQPAGAEPVGGGGPFVGPYVTAAGENIEAWETSSWVGTVNGGTYTEGNVIPIRFTSDSLPNGTSHTLVISYDFSSGTKRFIDHLASNALTSTQICGTKIANCGTTVVPVPAAIPTDTSLPAGAQLAGQLLRGYNVSSVAFVSASPPYGLSGGTKSVAVTFTVAGATGSGSRNVVLGWGVRLARENEWGFGNGASSASGGSQKAYGKLDSVAEKNVGINPGAILRRADLSITKSDSPDPVNAGSTLTYTIGISNAGPNRAIGVSVSDTIPALLTGVTTSYTKTAPAAGPANCTFPCSIGDLDAGASATITVTGTVPATTADGTTISNSASVSLTSGGTNPTDPDAANNSVGPITTTVKGRADLSLTKTDSPDPVAAGSNITYTLTVTNTSTAANGSTAKGISIVDTLPAGTSFVTAGSSSQCAAGTGQTVSCTVQDLAVGASATRTIVAAVDPSVARGSTLTNSATVSSSTFDPAGANNTATANTTVQDNRGPVANTDSKSTNEDTALTFASSDLTGNDTDADGDSLTVTAVTATASTHGTVSLATGNVTYTPAANYNGAASFTYSISDGNGGTATGTVNVTVSAVNDAPVNTVPGAQSTNEDTNKTFSSANSNALSVADVDVAETVNGTLKVTLSVVHGTLTLSGTAGLTFTAGDGANDATMTFAGTAAAINTALNGLVYSSVGNYNGSDTLTLTTDDQGNTGSGGAKTDTDTVAITVTAVNDAPAGADNSVLTAEDTAYTFVAADFGFTDANDTPADAFSRVKITTLETDGDLELNGVDVTVGQFVTVAAITAGDLKFNPSANESGSPYATFTFQVEDNGGGANLDPIANTMTVNVNPVNDAPVLDASGSPSLAAIDEDDTTSAGTLISSLIASGGVNYISDVDAGALEGLAITAADTTSGSWQYTTDGGTTWLALGAASNSSARLLAADADTRIRFVPNADFNGTIAAALTFRAWDRTSGTNGSLASTATNGGTSAFSSATDSASQTVNPVNDAPAGTNKTVSTNEDTAFTFAAADFGFTDPNDSPANALEAVKVTTAPTVGTLKNNGVTVNDGDVVLVAAIVAGDLKFYPVADANGSPYATFTFEVRDDGGTTNGGVNLDQSANTITVNVISVNDAPVNLVPGSQSVNEDSVLTLSGLNALSTSDLDAGSDDIQFSLSASNGVLTLGGPTFGLVAGPGSNGSSFMTFQGTVAEINAALNGTTYSPNANYYGNDSIVLLVDDLGHNGLGGTLTDSDAVAVTVNPVNDVPSFSKGANQTVNEDAAAQSVAGWATAISKGPANESGQAVDFIVTNNNNGLFSVQPAVGPAGTLSYTPAPNANGSATVTVKIHDDGGTLNGGVDTSAEQTFTITVTAVNDAPVVSNDNPTAGQTTQFSDGVADVHVTATDLDSAATSLNPGTITHVYTPLGGSALPAATGLPSGLAIALTTTSPGTASSTPGVLNPPSSRVWTVSGRMMVPAGSYAITIPVTDGSGTSSTTFTIAVTKEDAALEYSGDVFKNDTTSTTMSLAGVIREAGAAGGPAESPALIGDQLAGRQLLFRVYTFNGSFVTQCTGMISSTGSGTGTAGCQVTLNVSDDPYRVDVTLVDNNYYTALLDSATVVVQVNGKGFITGGGWLTEPSLGSKSNFGFTVKRLKNGNLQGNSNYIYRKTVAANEVAHSGGFLPAGPYNWQINSNSWAGGGLTQACTTSAPIKCTATFAGKANIKAINRITGVEYSLGGNYQYQVDVDDFSEPGSSPGADPDRYAIRVWDTSTGTYYQLGSPRVWNPATLWVDGSTGYGMRLPINGGNFQVHT